MKSVEPPDVSHLVPAGPDLVAALLDLAVPHEDIDAVLAARADVLKGVRGRRLADAVRRLCGAIGTRGRVDLPPAIIDPTAPPADRYFYLFAAVAVAPATRAHHRAIGIDESVSRATLVDIGRNVAVHRLTHGHGGFSDIGWCSLHLTGSLFQIGRLQFERASIGRRTAAGIAAAHEAAVPTVRPRDLAISVHIPRFSGPMDPQSCDQAIAAARTFFARYFPDERPAVAICISWLLDDQLSEYLPADSNIISFARRFRPAYVPDDDDRSTLMFVFGNPSIPLANLPRGTRLERAVIDHLIAGRHWRGGAGWFAW